MSKTIAPAPVRRAVTVKAPQARAFEAFTADMGRWWPKQYSVGSAPHKTATLEARVGGRWYETGEDGSECLWGEVLAWEPPSRMVLAWRISADWKYDPAIHTEVEVRFIPLTQGGTRVELEHRLLENLGVGEEASRTSFESDHGWGWLLDGYAAVADATVA
ncbi:SRPBCC family protein [Nitratireductor soli]|uniref:SRPBCC family protein n=1 Tax=Nitratireductor soli TaxID=1670619 RepID=UPI00065DEA05|nr:SRPBCC family protein [Nitratireductor soli]